MGNRLSSLSIPSYTFNSSNEVTAAGSSSYTYDNNGNTLTKTDSTGTTTYTWDFENRLASVHPPNQTTVTFNYDPLGRRIQKGGTVYLYNGANLIQEADGAGNLAARYVFATGVDEPFAAYRGGTWEFYQPDGLGSITSLSTITGTVSDSFVYDSFGNVVSTTGGFGQPFRYTGREWDTETGLYYYRARYYAPATGRFLSEDPMGLDAGINFYVYVLNHPTDLTDPMGLQSSAPWWSPWWWLSLLSWPNQPDPQHMPHRPGDSTVVFDRGAGTVTLYGPDGFVVLICEAHNNTTHTSNGPWPNGTYPFVGHNNHSANPNGPYGSYGIDVFQVPGRTGMGLHSGRDNRGGANAPTLGCVRTTDDCMRNITNYQATHPIESITVH